MRIGDPPPVGDLATKCYLCGGSEIRLEAERVRDSADIQVLACTECGLVFLSTADHISEDFYESSAMHESALDLDVWRRETAADDERRFRFCEPSLSGRRLLDFGCGNGAFLLRASEVTQEATGLDLETRAEADLRRHNIAFASTLSALEGPFDVVTMFHVLEHLRDPRATLRELAAKLAPNGEIIIEVPNAHDALLKLYEIEAFKAFTYWSCHLFLYTAATLRRLFDDLGATTGHIGHVQRYPLSNHLYWLRHGKPGGHKHWSFIDSPALVSTYEAQLADLGLTDTLIASITFPPVS